MNYHKCNVPGWETRLSEGSPSICPKHSELSEDWSESKIRQFREWAQDYLDGGRWAGFDYFTAIRTELLERDDEVKALHAKVSELERNARIAENEAQLFPIPRPRYSLSTKDKAGLLDLLNVLALNARASSENTDNKDIRKIRRDDSRWYLHLRKGIQSIFERLK